MMNQLYCEAIVPFAMAMASGLVIIPNVEVADAGDESFICRNKSRQNKKKIIMSNIFTNDDNEFLFVFNFRILFSNDQLI